MNPLESTESVRRHPLLVETCRLMRLKQIHANTKKKELRGRIEGKREGEVGRENVWISFITCEATAASARKIRGLLNTNKTVIFSPDCIK